jgi:hypothetical protein
MSRSNCVTSLLVGVALSLAAAVAAADAPRYTVSLDGTTLQAQVELCLAHAHQQLTFEADSPSAMHFVDGIKRSGKGSIEAGDGEWNAPDWAAGECLSYRADLAGIAATHDQDIGWKVGEDIVTAPQLWLLHPDVQGDDDADLSITLPDGMAVSAPWQRVGRDGASTHFHIVSTPPSWSAAVAFGHFSEERIELPGGVLRLTILSGTDAEQRKKLHDWLAHVSRAVLSAYGRLPLADVQVLMIPVGQLGMAQRTVARFAPRAVHFGQSIRGEGNALELLVDQTRPASEFDSDWIAVHELSHLMHPYLGDRGSWVSEGLATYYQTILRGRAGLLTRTQTWDRLRQGFIDNDGKQYDVPLDQAAAAMHRNHDYQRIYWSGAAFWLTVDRDLRRDSGGKLSMALALSRFRDCCLPSHRQWRPQDFFARLDGLLGVETFSKRYREFAALKQFPDWKKVYADLGIRDDAAGHVEFVADAPDAAARDQIVAPGQATSD